MRSVPLSAIAEYYEYARLCFSKNKNINARKQSFFQIPKGKHKEPLLPSFLWIGTMVKATSGKKTAAGKASSQSKKISVHKRRQENRRLFREVTDLFTTHLHIDQNSDNNSVSTLAAVVAEPMQTTPLAKDKAALRAKRKLQRKRRRLRKQQLAQDGGEGKGPNTIQSAVPTTARGKKKRRAKGKKSVPQQAKSQQQQSQGATASPQLNFAPPTFAYGGGGAVDFASPSLRW